MLLLLSDIGSDLNALGGSGWVGTGLLGAILSWLLLVRLPANDKSQRDLIDKWQTQTDILIERHDIGQRELVARHVAAMQAESERCDRQRVEARADYTHNLEAITASLTRAVETLGAATRERKP